MADAPDFFGGITAPQLSSGGYNPEDVKFDKYGNPILANATTTGTSEARGQQIQALQQLYDQQNGYAGARSDAERAAAISQGNQQAQGLRNAAQQNAMARGTFGSGDQLANEENASQAAANTSSMGGLAAASQRALAQIAASNGLAQGYGNVRGADDAQSLNNASILNQFNMYNTNLQNQVKQKNTDLANSQKTYNAGVQNDAYKYNQGTYNNNAHTQYQDQLDKARAQTGQGNNTRDFNQGQVNTGVSAGLQAAGTAASAAPGIYKAINSDSGVAPDTSGMSVEQSPGAVTIPNDEAFTFSGA